MADLNEGAEVWIHQNTKVKDAKKGLDMKHAKKIGK